jgi:hypothetical protein
MKLSEKSIEVLKNFTLINQGLVVNEDLPVFSRSIGSVIVAKCDFAEKFPKSFALHDLGNFLKVYSLFSDADLDFTDNSIELKSNGTSVRYYYSSPELVFGISEKEVEQLNEMSKSDSEDFILGGDELQSIIRASSVMNLDLLNLKSSDGRASAELTSRRNSTSNTFNIDLGDSNKDFDVKISVENMKFIQTTYEVAVFDRFITLYSELYNLKYWISLLQED